MIKLLPWIRVRALVTKLHKAYGLYKSHPWTIVINFWFAVGEQILQLLVAYLCARAVGVEVSEWRLLAALMLSQFLWKFSLILEGWVLGGFVVVLMCSFVDIHQTQTLAFFLLGNTLSLIASVPGGVLFLTTRKLLRREIG
jgi:hypothetical protein